MRAYVAADQIKEKNKLSEFLNKNKNRLFELKDNFECSGKDCESLPEKTRMFFFRALFFDLVIAKEKGQLKIVRIYSISD